MLDLQLLQFHDLQDQYVFIVDVYYSTDKETDNETLKFR